MTTEADSEIRVIQEAKTEQELTRPVEPGATDQEIVAATCSCVVHLCGCRE